MQTQIPDPQVRDFASHLVRVNDGDIAVGLYGSRVHRLVLGVESPPGTDLDLAYATCGFNGNDIKPFNALKLKAMALRDRLGGYTPAGFSDGEFICPWVSYVNSRGSFFKPGVRSEDDFSRFDLGYTVNNVILLTDGREGRIIDGLGGVRDLFEGRLRFPDSIMAALGSKDSRWKTSRALLGLKYKHTRGMDFDPDTLQALSQQMSRVTFTSNELTDASNLRMLGDILESGDPQQVAEELKALRLDEFRKLALRYDDNRPLYKRIRHK
ncbi:MAG: hypothetical protein ABIH11_08560 [Candidatus Altiarchaeota archaeon]